ncbi:MAG: bifunctional riboflavin kinase/FAD synthetase [Actinomycetota bacterium]
MRVVRGLEDLPSRRRPAALTIGNFDGVHRGHAGVIRRLLTHAESRGSTPTAVTFDPHPRLVLQGVAPPALATLERRLELLAEAGVARAVVLTFDRRLAQVEPEEFIERILVDELRATSIVVGSMFRFGHLARGDTTMLRRFGRRLGYAFEGVRLMELKGRRVSSTEVRHAISEGDLVWANLALGRPHRLPGRVVRGAGRGRGLGFPTANLALPPGMCLPQVGIYAGWLEVGRRRLACAASVGTNPTYGANPISVEAHVIDFDEDLYAREAALDLEARIRDEQRFDSPEELAKAIAADVEEARRLLFSAAEARRRAATRRR